MYLESLLKCITINLEILLPQYKADVNKISEKASTWIGFIRILYATLTVNYTIDVWLIPWPPTDSITR